MIKTEHILFDLDGTITKSDFGITRSVQKALEYFGIVEEDNSKLIKFVGPLLRESFIKYYNFNDDMYVKALKIFKEYYSVKGIFESELYDGIEHMLSKLSLKGSRLYIATSKPEDEAVRVLKHFNLYKYFDFVGGSDGDYNTSRSTKAAVISYVLDYIKGNFPEDTIKEKTVMVGDRMHDIEGAESNGLFSVGVLYGYGSLEELKAAGADRICNDIDSLSEFLLKNISDV